MEKESKGESGKSEIKITDSSDKVISTMGTKVKKNPWMLVSLVLGILVIALLILTLRGGVSGNVVKGDDAGQKIVDFLNGRTGGGVEYVSYTDKGDIYEVSVSYQGQNIPVYITKDGEYFVQGAVPITGDAVDNNAAANNQQPSADVPKTDKPKVEAFIFSYCPYGLQFEKALFPVYDLLKNKADINIVAIGAMHGEYEKVETLRQISIEKLYSRDKLFAYLKEFDVSTNIGSCSGDEACLNKYLPAIYTKLGIDKAKVEAYMKSNAGKLYDEQNARANELGIGGSPTFVINGVEVSVSRTPDAIKQAVCNAFNTAPSECSQTLSTAAASAGFGASTGSASASANSAAGCAPA